MKIYWTFLKAHFQPVFFGWLLTFFSSFGQTFLISLFVPFILGELLISKGAFGGYYAVATIIASFILLRFGHIIDERPVRPFTVKVVVLLSASSLLLAATVHPAMLFVALIGLRLAGQGLMGHISLSLMSRYFDKDRGKALSISSLGYSFGEMIFPILLGGIISLWNWRIAAIASGVMVFSLLPLLFRLHLEKLDEHHQVSPDKEVPKSRFFWLMMKKSKFWIVALPSFALSFTITGFFFYQFLLADAKGWPRETYTLFFAGYGAVRLIFSLYGGVLTDKFSAVRIFPFYILPLILGVASLFVSDDLIGAAIFLFFTGVSVGMSGIVKSAIIAEIYGVEQIGKVRSLFTVVMVISTALAPFLFGLGLDSGFSFEQIAMVVTGFLVLVALHNFRILSYK